MKKITNNISFDVGLNKLFGYDKLFNNFVTLFNTNKLPKVLILTGDKGIGKFTFVFHFINFVLSKQDSALYDKENFSIQFNSEIIKKIKSNVAQNFNYLGCEKPSNVEDSLRKMLNHNGPVIMDMITDKAENVYPMIPAGAAHYELKLNPDSPDIKVDKDLAARQV